MKTEVVVEELGRVKTTALPTACADIRAMLRARANGRASSP